MTLDPSLFRQTLGLFATGVTVVVAQAGDEVLAMTANAVSSLSLDPMLVLFCPGKKANIAQVLDKMTGFSLNILREDQEALSTYFAGGWKAPTPPPFRFVPCEGAPRLEGCLAAIGCERRQIVEGGDHWIVVGRVVALHQGMEPRRPLVFYGGKYQQINPAESKPAPDLSNVETPPQIFYDPWEMK
jgi:flavin reductase (DIM6/NTAB) family NADH-FMN oxidoreductase RutF